MTSEVEETKDLAQGILSTRFGELVKLDEGSVLHGRDYVFRFPVLQGPPEAPSQAIAKRARYGAASTIQRPLIPITLPGACSTIGPDLSS